MSRLLSSAIVFQSTRPRGRTRLDTKIRYFHCGVSIHASSREDATCLATVDCEADDVSIHASSREDATESCAYVARYIMFQSTRPRGRTRQIRLYARCHKAVSIHASSREDATLIVSNVTHDGYGFNPRVLAGGRDY